MVTKRRTSAEQRAYEARLWWAVQPQWLWRLARLTLRCAWVAALAAALGWLTTRALDLAVPLVSWLAAGFALFMLLLPLVALWPLPLKAIARRMDASFGLADRVTTAHEIAQRKPQNYMEARLLTATHRLLGTVRARLVRAPRVPWVDLELVGLAALALYGCYLLAGPTPPATPVIPPPVYEGLPPLASDVTVPLPGQGVVAPADQVVIDAAAAQQVLQALIEALNANSVTQPAGAALAQGDTHGSAQALRGVADAADGLSAGTRAALAQSLAEAAAQTRPLVPSASKRILATAGALLSETPGVAAAGLEDLAQLIEDLEVARQPDQTDGQGQNGDAEGAGSGSGDATGRETEADGTTERLEGESEPVALPTDEQPLDEDSVLQPPDHTGTATDQTDTPYTQSGANGSGGDPASDPLNFPWRLRNVVQRYFSPR